MVADWIKMRSDLYRDPKVCVIADALMEEGGALARYVNQMCQRDMTVTRNVMRNVTVGALVSVWGVMRQRGKREGDSLVCLGVCIGVIDDIADLPGFGAAMAEAGWVIDREDGIEFPRFFDEYNTDPGESAKAKNAERQRKYREKKVTLQSVTRNVTVTHREEKSREEIPPNPQGLRGWLEIKIPEKLNTERFKNALERWALVLVEKGNYSPIAIQEVVEKFYDHGERKAVGYLKAWTATNRFMAKWDDCYEAYIPPEVVKPSSERTYAPKPPIKLKSGT